jgi:penicillin amidase
VTRSVAALSVALSAIGTSSLAIAGRTGRDDIPTPIAGLSTEVRTTIDALGIPSIAAGSELDAYRVEGWYHARDRFGAMDLFRRAAAGELAEWVGAAAVPADRERRTLGLRGVAERAFASLPERSRSILEAYASGVNAGLAARGKPPAEHAAFAFGAAPWRPEDTLLVILSLAWRLNEDALLEIRLGPALAELPEGTHAFLLGSGGSEAPVAGPAGPDGESAPIPGPETIDLRRSGRETPHEVPPGPDAKDTKPGSNAFAISGRLTRHGSAILAGDMHLALSIPGVWYRIELAWPGIRLIGFSLPGVPGIIAGSNGQVAWTFTNLHGDFLDHVIIEVDPADPTRYLVPDGSEPFGSRLESIAVRGGKAESLEVRTTRWGPVVGADAAGRPLALRWSVADEGGLDLGLLGLSTARTVDEALDAAASSGGPPQNILVAGRDGRIGWTVSGRLPVRRGFDGLVPRSWADGRCRWDGVVATADRPRVVDPPEGFLVSANQRPLPGASVASMGNLWPATDRAVRIRDRITAGSPDATARWDEPSVADIQLDTLVPRLDRWRRVALRTIDAGPDSDPASDEFRLLASLREPLRRWDGHAAPDAEVVELLELFRRACARSLRDGLAAAGYPTLKNLPFPDLTALRLAESRPAHWLPPPATEWDAFLRDRLVAAARDPRTGGSLRPWGETNRLAIAHPLSANPLIKMRMAVPTDPQPGHALAVRVATPGFGASQRMTVAPGHEPEGLFAMPLGQSGDPLDGHFLDHHGAWLAGGWLPFAAGPVETTRRFGPPS